MTAQQTPRGAPCPSMPLLAAPGKVSQAQTPTYDHGLTGLLPGAGPPFLPLPEVPLTLALLPPSPISSVSAAPAPSHCGLSLPSVESCSLIPKYVLSTYYVSGPI